MLPAGIKSRRLRDHSLGRRNQRRFVSQEHSQHASTLSTSNYRESSISLSFTLVLIDVTVLAYATTEVRARKVTRALRIFRTLQIAKLAKVTNVFEIIDSALRGSDSQRVVAAAAILLDIIRHLRRHTHA